MYSPDERRAIRSEMNRDAMPSKEEAKASAREHLRQEGCKHCDEDDPDNLQQVNLLLPNCSALQTPREPFVVLCDDCLDDRPDSHVEKRLDGAEESGYDVAVVYKCDTVQAHNISVPEVDMGNGETAPHPHAPPNAKLDAQCRCGARITDLVYFEEGDD